MNMKEKCETVPSSISRMVCDCQICGSTDLKQVLFLGYIPPVNYMPKIGTRATEHFSFPAELLQCSKCHLVQLGCAVNKDHIFPEEYPYVSGTTKILSTNFEKLVEECTSYFYKPAKTDLIVDIGSNDGTLLSKWLPHDCRVCGVEPTGRAQLAINRGIETYNEFFCKDVAQRIVVEKSKAKVITAANVFAHIDGMDDVMEGIRELLDDEGLFISESHYLLDLVNTLQYDTVYHEHLRYYSLTALNYLFQEYGFEVVHAKRIPTHGGSIRVYAARPGVYAVRDSVAELLLKEKPLINGNLLKQFSQDVLKNKRSLWALLASIKNEDKRIYGISAPSRASTLVNYVGIDSSIIDCILEVSGSPKIGKTMPGTDIPVLEESILLEEQPEYAFIFSWHIAEELIPKLKSKGYKGKFIIPLPVPTLVD